MDALTGSRSAWGASRVQAGASGGGFQRVAHLDVGGSEGVAREPPPSRQFAFEESEMARDLRIDICGERLVGDHPRDRPNQKRRGARQYLRLSDPTNIPTFTPP